MDTYSLEIFMKAASNKHRIDAMMQLKNTPDLSVEELSNLCTIDYKTLSSHLKRLADAKLITKKHYGRRVEHRLTDSGVCFVDFMRSL